MNNILSTTSKWIGQGSLLIASTTLLGSLAGADPTGPEQPIEQPALTAAQRAAPNVYDDLREALKGGKFWVGLRYRYEDVDTGGGRDASASTLQTRLGYESGEYRHFSGLLEFSDVSTIGNSNYNSLLNDKTQYAVVADPRVTVVNQAYGKYNGIWNGDLKFGRQRIKLDNDRFIGNVGWRQTEQVYDALSYKKADLSGISLFYAYVTNVNTILATNQKSGHHLLNASKAWDNIGKLSAYGYYLDFDQNDLTPAGTSMAIDSTGTFGARFSGKHAFPDFTLLYDVELAHQKDVADNNRSIDAGYQHFAAGCFIQGFTAKAGIENLDGSATDPGDFSNNGGDGRSFQTPLATKFGFNGWADMFLVTPPDGLQDIYLKAGYTWNALDLQAIYHNFDRDRGDGGKYGSEIDLVATYELAEGTSVGIKYADYSAKNYLMDTQKFWLWISHSF